MRSGLETSDKSTFSAQELLDILQALLIIVEAMGDDEVDALVDDGGEGAGQGLVEIGRVGHEEGLVVWIGHGGDFQGPVQVRFRDRGAGSRALFLSVFRWVELIKRQSSTGLLEENTLQIRHSRVSLENEHVLHK